MRTFISKTIGIVFIALMLIVNTNIFAQRGNGMGNGQGNRNGQGYGQANQNSYIVSNIPNLTADQKTKLDVLRSTHFETMQNYSNQLRLNNKTAEERNTISINMQNSREKHLQDVRGLLTTDQKMAFDKLNLEQNSRQNFGSRKGNRRGNGNGQGRGNGRNF